MSNFQSTADLVTENRRLREELERAKCGEPDDWARLVTIVDEAYGMQPRMLNDELLTFLEHELHKDRAENLRMQESIDLYRATIARVEALPAWWRGRLAGMVATGRAGAAVREVVRECARDIEHALKGGEP